MQRAGCMGDISFHSWDLLKTANFQLKVKWDIHFSGLFHLSRTGFSRLDGTLMRDSRLPSASGRAFSPELLKKEGSDFMWVVAALILEVFTTAARRTHQFSCATEFIVRLVRDASIEFKAWSLLGDFVSIHSRPLHRVAMHPLGLHRITKGEFAQHCGCENW